MERRAQMARVQGSAVGTFETCQPSQKMSVLGIDRKWLAHGKMTRFDPKETSPMSASSSSYRLLRSGG
jgi:hypothetical protein